MSLAPIAWNVPAQVSTPVMMPALAPNTLARIDAVGDQVGDPMGQGVGRARFRPCDDGQRRGHTASLTADAMFDGTSLLDIQYGEVVESIYQQPEVKGPPLNHVSCFC